MSLLLALTAGASYTLGVDSASYSLTYSNVGLNVTRAYRLGVDTKAYSLTYSQVGFTVVRAQQSSGGYEIFQDYRPSIKKKQGVKKVKEIINHIAKEAVNHGLSEDRALAILNDALEKESIIKRDEFERKLAQQRDILISLEIKRLIEIKMEIEDNEDAELLLM